LALQDFQKAIHLKPNEGEAYYGRAYSRVKLGKYASAIEDIQKALNRPPRSARLLWIAARVYAQAVRLMPAAANERNFRAQELRSRYQDRAAALLDQALAELPAPQQAVFWEKLQPDKELDPIRRSAGFVRLEAKYLRLTKARNAKK
jgi:tetratricopeptide (TPR) repeat protein